MTAAHRFAGVLVAICLLISRPALPQDVAITNPQVKYDDYHDTSIPMRDTPQLQPMTAGFEVIPLHRVNPLPFGIHSSALKGSEVSPVSGPSSITNLVGFDGISWDGFYPPDPNASVGATQIVETVN